MTSGPGRVYKPFCALLHQGAHVCRCIHAEARPCGRSSSSCAHHTTHNSRHRWGRCPCCYQQGSCGHPKSQLRVAAALPNRFSHKLRRDQHRTSSCSRRSASLCEPFNGSLSGRLFLLLHLLVKLQKNNPFQLEPVLRYSTRFWRTLMHFVVWNRRSTCITYTCFRGVLRTQKTLRT